MAVIHSIINLKEIPNPGNLFWNSPAGERVLQFGTGMLLRALPDWIIDRFNASSQDGGSIVMVKSTSGDKGVLQDQLGLYTVIEAGLEEGKMVRRPRIIRSISRILAAETEWSTILDCARNRHIDIIISNATEAGLAYVQEDILLQPAPKSFPGKLTRYLWERFQTFQGDPDAGMVILPTELLVDNGPLLHAFVRKHAVHANLPQEFLEWLDRYNHFCSTLVDRIVPGKCEPGDVVTYEGVSYLDRAHTAAEPYLLWAIQGNEDIKSRLWFAPADSRVIVTQDLTPYREQKLRILNGSNTMVAAVGFLAGCDTTYDTMTDPLICSYVEGLVYKEILPTLTGRCPDAESFAAETLDRFRNEAIRYPLLTIAKQYTAKMNSRNIETIFRCSESGLDYKRLLLGLAAYMVFHQAKGKENNVWYALRGPERYSFTDDHVEAVCSICSMMGDNPSSVSAAVCALFQNPVLFSSDLTSIPGLTEVVVQYVLAIQKNGMRELLRNSDF